MKSPFKGENEAGVDLVLIQSFQRYFVNYVSYANQHFFKQNVHKKRNHILSRVPNPPVLAGKRPFSENISGLLFSPNIIPVFETLPSQRKRMFSSFNQFF